MIDREKRNFIRKYGTAAQRERLIISYMNMSEDELRVWFNPATTITNRLDNIDIYWLGQFLASGDPRAVDFRMRLYKIFK